MKSSWEIVPGHALAGSECDDVPCNPMAEKSLSLPLETPQYGASGRYHFKEFQAVTSAPVTQPHRVDRHVGALIRAKRKAMGISQTELAEALGITFQQVQKYERGANRVSSSKLYEIAQKLDTPLSSFFEGLDQPAGGESVSGELIDFLGGSGSQDLVSAFKALKPQLQRRLVDLAKAMAEKED